MAVRYSTGLLNKLLGDSAVTAGSNGLAGILKDGIIEIYSGSQPATADSAVTGTLLATVTQNAGAFSAGSPTNGLEFAAPVGNVLSKSSSETWQYTGVAAGTAGYFRFKGNAVDAGGSSTLLPRIDGSIGTVSGDMILSTTSIVIGTPGTVDVFSITMT